MNTTRKRRTEPQSATTAAAQSRGREVRARRGSARRATPLSRSLPTSSCAPSTSTANNTDWCSPRCSAAPAVTQDRPPDRSRAARAKTAGSSRSAGPRRLRNSPAWVPAAGHAREYGRIVRDNALMRALLTATYEIQAQIGERRRGGEELIEEAERLIFALRGRRRPRPTATARARARGGDRLGSSRPPRTIAPSPGSHRASAISTGSSAACRTGASTSSPHDPRWVRACCRSNSPDTPRCTSNSASCSPRSR